MRYHGSKDCRLTKDVNLDVGNPVLKAGGRIIYNWAVHRAGATWPLIWSRRVVAYRTPLSRENSWVRIPSVPPSVWCPCPVATGTQARYTLTRGPLHFGVLVQGQSRKVLNLETRVRFPHALPVGLRV
jgi:hypothetical protein